MKPYQKPQIMVAQMAATQNILVASGDDPWNAQTPLRKLVH